MVHNHLWKTSCYLIGSMQYADGSSWREKMTLELNKMKIRVFDPYKKPFIKDVQESNDAQTELLKAQEQGNFDYLQKKMREIRSFDLNLVDRSDFIIANISPRIASWGTGEELTTSNRAKKPIFLAIEGGKLKCPLWIFGMIPHKYIYNNPEEIVEVLKNINSGEKELDSDRWRLLRRKFR